VYLKLVGILPDALAKEGQNMKRVLILAVLLGVTAFARAQDVAGDWQGTLLGKSVHLD
jgi:hypothetical protein